MPAVVQMQEGCMAHWPACSEAWLVKAREAALAPFPPPPVLFSMRGNRATTCFYFQSPARIPPLPPPTVPCLQACLLAACPGAWSRLRRLAVADGRDVPRIPSLPSLACLAGLSSLRFYQRDGFALPGPLTALRHLSHLHAAVSRALLGA